MTFADEKLEKLDQALSGRRSIVVTGHQSPDGDAIGSCLALAHYLKKRRQKVTVVMPDHFPEFLNWMKGAEDIVLFENEREKASQLMRDADIIFSLDYNSPRRVGKEMSEVLVNAQSMRIMIDHHQDPEDFADLAFVDSDCCSTAQLVYELIDAMADLHMIDREMANCIYTGIMTDTGSFRFPATTAQTHRIVADLIERGAENSRAHVEVYDTSLLSRLRLMGHALKDKLVVKQDLGVAYIYLDKHELEKYGYQKGDTEGLVNYALSLKGINMAAFFSEKGEKIKISFRSAGNIPVNQFASQHFHGGGHTNAAGGMSLDSMDDTINRFETLLPEWLSSLGK